MVPVEIIHHSQRLSLKNWHHSSVSSKCSEVLPSLGEAASFEEDSPHCICKVTHMVGVGDEFRPERHRLDWGEDAAHKHKYHTDIVGIVRPIPLQTTFFREHRKEVPSTGMQKI